jgi:phage-related minor tail protein
VSPGWKTSEFWRGLASDVLGWLLAAGVVEAGGWVGQVVGGAVVALGGAAYCHSRAKVKASSHLEESEDVED